MYLMKQTAAGNPPKNVNETLDVLWYEIEILYESTGLFQLV